MTDINQHSEKPRPRHPLIGTMLGRYEIVDEIGMGGVGMVLKGQVPDTGEIAAIKLIPHDLNANAVKRLEVEAKILRDLDHPNIVKTIDFITTDTGHKALIIEHVAGKNLKEILSREVVMPVIRALAVFLQISDAMQFAHSKGVLHRDLKPHNVMIADEPRDLVKILDFGIAKITEDPQHLTMTGEVLGSPIYMSPEQSEGRELDERTDIYSFGVLMYQVLTGSAPYRGTSSVETISLKTSQPPPPFKEVAPGLICPASLEKLVLSCLNPEREHRPRTMRQLKTDLEQVLLSMKDPSSLPSKDPARRSYSSIPATSKQTIDSFVNPIAKTRAKATEEISTHRVSADYHRSRADTEQARQFKIARNSVVLGLLIILATAAVTYVYLNLSSSSRRTNQTEAKQPESQFPQKVQEIQEVQRVSQTEKKTRHDADDFMLKKNLHSEYQLETVNESNRAVADENADSDSPPDRIASDEKPDQPTIAPKKRKTRKRSQPSPRRRAYSTWQYYQNRSGN